MDDVDLPAIARMVERAIAERRSDPVARAIDAAQLRESVARFSFESPQPLGSVIEQLVALLRSAAVRSDHPAYFGLFNPPALPEAIAGDLVAAAINPQLAVWSHAPAAAEIERSMVRFFGRLAWPDSDPAGTFTSGGSEANATALMTALAGRYPDWAERGVAGVRVRPAIFTSSESHLAWIKIARTAGLGSNSVRLVPARDGLRMSAADLEQALRDNTEWDPVLIVGTAGTTAHGAIDDLDGIAAIARSRGLHFHVDAAWAGSALLSDARRALFSGIEQADSITLDPHKWLSVPMGAGLYLDRSWDGLSRAFSVATGYMPSASIEHRDAYIHSFMWSRRFTGAKLFTALATLGRDGYAALIERAFALGDRLRNGLREQGWHIVNDSVLPLVVFVPDGGTDEQVRIIEKEVAQSGRAWISTVALRGRLALRACITSYETTEADVDDLIRLLAIARNA